MPKLGRFEVCETRQTGQEVIFGLTHDQKRTKEFVRDAWWFVLGEDGRAYQLSTGDLIIDDIKLIADQLQEGECFIIADEHAPYREGGIPLHAMCCKNKAILDRQQIRSIAAIVIRPKAIIFVDPDADAVDGVRAIKRSEISAHV